MSRESPDADSEYRERLWPGALGWAAVASVGIVAAIALLPIDPTVAVVAGALALAFAVVAAVVSAPVVTVHDGELRVARTHIPVTLLGPGTAIGPDQRRDALGRNLDARAYVCLRAWIPAVVRWDVQDPQDRTPYWIVSTRHPDELLVAVAAAQGHQA